MSTEQKNVRIVKKYNNRKLYDTETSKYVTLSNLVELVKGGTLLSVIEHSTKTDVTIKTLLQALVETDEVADFDAKTLHEIVKAGGLTNYLRNRDTTVGG